MPHVIRLGDPGSHGGTVVTASGDVKANGIGVARIGDTYDCPDHGPNPIASGSPDTYANGRRVARVGDTTACGATLLGGSPDVEVN
jgi:uncharacterized Zn-binding protein involved in type VI secretion